MMGADYGYGYDPYSQRAAGQDDEKEVRKGIFSKVLIALIVAANLAFVAVVLMIFCSTYSEPSTLIMAWFGFSTGELWALAFVKKQKLKKEDKTLGIERKSDWEEGNGSGITEGDGSGSGGGAETDSADQ